MSNELLQDLPEVTSPASNDLLYLTDTSNDNESSKIQAANLIGITVATLTNKTFNTAGTGNSLLINGLAVTANTGTGSVVRATSPTVATPSISGDVTVLAGASVALVNASANSTAFLFNNGGSGANLIQTASAVKFTSDLKITTPTNVSTSALTTDATQTLTNKTISFNLNTLTNVASTNTAQTISGQKTFTQTAGTITSYSPIATGTATLDLSLGNIFTINVPAGNFTVAVTNAVVGQWFTIRFVNDASVRTVTYFTTIKWPGGSAPALSGTAGRIDTRSFLITGASTYDGYVVGTNLS